MRRRPLLESVRVVKVERLEGGRRRARSVIFPWDVGMLNNGVVAVKGNKGNKGRPQ